MSVSSASSTGTIDYGRVFARAGPSAFVEFCAKVRNVDSSILPEFGKPFKIRRTCEEEDIALAVALLENTSVTYLELETESIRKSLQRQCPNTYAPASTCNVFVGTENWV
jgi:hypothetical protein